MNKAYLQLQRLRKHCFLSLLFILTFSGNAVLYAQNNSFGNENPIIQVQHWGIEEGLSHRYVTCVHQDKSGLMWFGTVYGLNRFDGHEFKWFTEEKHGLQNNQIDQILEDESGRMWLFHTGSFHSRYAISIDLFDPLTEKVIAFEEAFGGAAPFAAKDILSFNKNKLGHLVFVTSDKLVIYTDHFQIYPLANTKLNGIRRVHWTDEGLFWLVYFHNEADIKVLTVLDSTGTMLHRYDFAKSHYLYLWDLGEGSMVRVSDFKKNDPFQESLQQYLILEPEGMIQTDTLAEKLFSDRGITQDLTSPFLKKCFGHYWTLTAASDFVLVPELESQDLIILSEEYPHLKNATSIFQDDMGAVWVSSEFGVFRIKLEQPKFRRILHNIKDEQTGELIATRGMATAQTSNGTSLFVMAERSGQLTKIDLQSGEQKIMEKIGDHRWAVAKLPDEQLIYVGPEGIHQISPETGQLMNQYPFQNKGDAIGVTFLHQDKYGKIWYANRYRRKLNYLWNDHQVTLKSGDGNSGYFYQFNENETDTAWVGSNHGLFRIDIHTDEVLERYWKNGEGKYHLSFDHVLHFVENEDGTFWLGTSGGGLLKWSPDEGVIERYTRADGLPNNTIYAVYPDDHGNLWLPTDYGICAFNPITERVKSYTTKDGLSYNEFNRISHCADEEGNIYFGSLNGITAFHPDDFVADSSIAHAPLVITSFQQYDGDADELVDKTAEVRSTQKIILEPNDPLIRLQFSLLTMEDVNNTLYAYQLDGVDENWTYQEENSIRFGRLPYGNHTLLIKGQAAGGQWSDQILRIQVVSLRPFYLKSWFILSCIIFLLGGFFLFYRQREKSLIARQAKLENIVKERTATIEKQKEELKSLDELKSRFFANVSHELRTPLTLILGPLGKLLKSGEQRPKRYLELINFMHHNSQQLLKLVNEILDLSKLEKGRLEVETEPVNLQEFLNPILAQFSSYAQSNGIEFQIKNNIPASLNLLLDRGKVEKIIYNYLSNALKFTAEGGTVNFTAMEDNNEMIFQVTDTGPGIPAEDLPFVFDRFFQTKQKNKSPQGGTGIGLSLAKELAVLLGGRVGVESVWGKGSTFWVRFPTEVFAGQPHPIEVEAPQQLIKNGLPQKSPVNYSEEGTKKILLVEDNAELRNYLGSILGGNYHFQMAENGQVAWSNLKKATVEELPDLIISDVMMPIMDGIELLGKIKGNDLLCQIPVIMLTARADSKMKLQALRLGVDDYLTKPFQEEELMVRMANLLKNYARRQAAPVVENGKSSGIPTLATISPADREWLETFEAYVQKNIANNALSISYLSSEFAMSESTLRRQVARLTGLTPKLYLQEVRLNAARQFLENQTYRTVAKVAEKAGYSNYRTFTRNYKERFGKSPREYLNV
ncbi:MAG: ATP-binding protein [Bacteroidota bacterium]